MIIVTLVQCGDIQTNPGPVNSINKKKRTYKIRFPCVRCQLGIRIRPVKCINCHNLTHSKCIEGLTNELYDKFRNNNEEIVFKCNYCVHSNIPNNIHEAFVPLPPMFSDEEAAAAAAAAAAPPLTTNSSKQNIRPSRPTNPTDTRDTNPADATGAHQGELCASLNTNKHTQEKFNVICKCCQKSIKTSNKKRSCNCCGSIFHPKCYKTVSINDNLCNICLSQELPFYTFNEDSKFDTLILEQSLINPSEMPESTYNCFRTRGLHLIYINAMEMTVL